MAEEKKKKPGKRDHLKDFYQDVTGKYIYGGAHYVSGMPQADYKQLVRKLWLCAGSALLGLILAGCIPAAGMGEGFWVLPFYLGEIISTIMVCWSLWEFTGGGDPIRAYVYEANVDKIPRRCEFGMVFGILCLAGFLLHLLVSGMGKAALWATVLFVVIQFVAVVGLFYVKKLLQSVKWTKK